MRLIEMVGRRFGRLVVLKRVANKVHPKGQVQAKYRAKCDCGNVIEVVGICLRQGTSQSCGCLRTELVVKHGEARGYKKTREYAAWNNMINRCTLPNAPYYGHYGGRGIKVCKRWRRSYKAFLDDMGRKPSPSHSLDRIDNNGNYEPGNCRWATRLIQNRNKRQRQKKK